MRGGCGCTSARQWPFVYDCSINVLLQACKDHFLSHKQTALSCILWKDAKEQKGNPVQQNMDAMRGKSKRRKAKIAKEGTRMAKHCLYHCQAVPSRWKQCQEVPVPSSACIAAFSAGVTISAAVGGLRFPAVFPAPFPMCPRQPYTTCPLPMLHQSPNSRRQPETKNNTNLNSS